ncbi:MAG: cbb3-type cytochrome c oxidase subunit 3 [Pseudobdellovibrio sp.]
MKQLGLSFFTDTYLTVIGLMIFFGYFLMITIKTIKETPEQINYLQNIPLENEDKHGK